ncbi:MAG: SOS response-associated peptidase [Chromatiales bacterium]|nr:SOS response-associated peptidase [Chromatiales bacterium]
MCGRYTNHTPSYRFSRILGIEGSGVPDLPPRYNISPGSHVLAAREDSDAGPQLVMLRWGLVPFWAKEPSIGNRLINARAETVASKPAFRAAFRHRRALVCADGFYEWAVVAGGKHPHHFRMRDGEPFFFAALWERWDREGPVVESCTLITTTANECVSAVHDRMPVILAQKDYAKWLDPEFRKPDELQAMLAPYPAEAMEGFPVSRAVNRPANDQAQLLEPVQQDADR